MLREKKNLPSNLEKQMEMEQELKILEFKTLTKKSRERLSNVKIVNKDLYLTVMQVVIDLYNKGRINEKKRLDEEELLEILKKCREKRGFRIRRV